MGGAGEPSIFDGFQEDERIVAFFPCTRFEDQITLYMRGEAVGQKRWSEAEKLRYAMRLQNEVNEMYQLISYLALICVERGLRLIIENPAGGCHYLTRYWPLKPKWIDHDRRERGDNRKKPTQYWFINFDPRHNFVLEAMLLQTDIKTHNKTHSQVERSIIMPQYARRFIQEFILEDPNDNPDRGR